MKENQGISFQQPITPAPSDHYFKPLHCPPNHQPLAPQPSAAKQDSRFFREKEVGMRSDDENKAAWLQTGRACNWQHHEGLLPWLVQPEMMGHKAGPRPTSGPGLRRSSRSSSTDNCVNPVHPIAHPMPMNRCMCARVHEHTRTNVPALPSSLLSQGPRQTPHCLEIET